MVNLEKLVIMNPWWSKDREFTLYDRDLLAYNDRRRTPIQFKRLDRFYSRLKPGNIFLLKGPRRIGKTLMLKLLVARLLDGGVPKSNILYFSFDSIVTKKELDNMLRDFLARASADPHRYILLDEAQNVEGWEEIIKALYDAGMLADAVVIATGSIAHMLKGETLPGRGVEGDTMLLKHITFRDFVLALLNDIDTDRGVNVVNKLLNYTFTNKEMESLRDYVKNNEISLEAGLDVLLKKVQELGPYATPVLRLFNVYMHTGGYPASINSYVYNALNKNEGTIDANLYEEIYSYAKQDAALIGGKAAGDPAKASKIIEEVLTGVGTAASYSSISRGINMNTATVINYFERIENSFVFSSIYGLDSSLAQMKKRKTYFSDLFMHYACGAASKGMSGPNYTEELLNSSSLGILVEEMVLDHLTKTKEQDPMKHYKTFINFYNAKNEIDFLYKCENGRHIAVESKYRNSVQASRIAKIKGVENYLILGKGEIESTRHGIIVPAALFLLLLEKSQSNI